MLFHSLDHREYMWAESSIPLFTQQFEGTYIRWEIEISTSVMDKIYVDTIIVLISYFQSIMRFSYGKHWAYDTAIICGSILEEGPYHAVFLSFSTAVQCL